MVSSWPLDLVNLPRCMKHDMTSNTRYHFRLEEMEYRLIKSELDVFHAYESWIGNQYEYLEILYNSWRSADRPNSK